MTEKRKLIFFQWLVISVFSVLIILLIIQNLTLKKKQPQDGGTHRQYIKSRQFEGILKGNFLFKKFPIAINMDEFYFKSSGQNINGALNGYIIILFDVTVCGNCLQEELRVLNNLKPLIADKNLIFLAIAGLVDSSEEATIISLNRSRLLTFPCKVISVGELYEKFNLNKENFLDTPFFMYLSHEYIVLDVFKPQYLDTKELSTWLEIIAGQDIF